MKKILICGLPGTGKTTLAQELRKLFQERGKTVIWYNADELRNQHQDWDFSENGRLRQAERMRYYANTVMTDYVICDFVAPTEEIRNLFDADYTIWMDTEEKSEYEDTDKVFEKPSKWNFVVKAKDAENVSRFVLEDILQRR